MEAKTKYEKLREDLMQVRPDYDPRCEAIIGHDLPEELGKFAMAFKSDQSNQCYIAFLINLVIMSQGSIWTEDGSYRLSEQDIAKIKAVLREKVDYVDRQFAYICYLIQRLGLLNKEQLAELVSLVAAIQSSYNSLDSLKDTKLLRLVKERVTKELEKEEPVQRQSLLRMLDFCISNFGSLGNDPFADNVNYSFNEGETLQRFSLSNTVNNGRYHDSLSQFNDVNFKENLTVEMKDSVSELSAAAKEFYLRPDVRVESRNACKNLMNELFGFTREAARVLKNSEGNDVPNNDVFFSLIGQAEEIHRNIDALALEAPHDLHWGKIIGVMLGTLFLVCYG